MPHVTAGGFEVDYDDLATAAESYRRLGNELRAGQLAPGSGGVGVYGAAGLAVAVARVTGALRSRQQGLATHSAQLAAALTMTVAAYRTEDAEQAAVYQQLMRQLTPASTSTPVHAV